MQKCTCGNIFKTPPDREAFQYAECPSCGKLANRLIEGLPTLVNFRAGVYEHIAIDPIYCKNKRELREACKKHGKTSVYLEDM